MRDALPNASFIAFTGTPIKSDDRSTPAVFGDYIDVYDIQRVVEDEVTVRIYYEGRLAKLELKADERPKIDPDFEEATEGGDYPISKLIDGRIFIRTDVENFSDCTITIHASTAFLSTTAVEHRRNDWASRSPSRGSSK
jgi:type I site-specific restriction-modification system R (restriction) subunit